MQIQLKKQDGVDMIALEGDLDYHCSAELRTQFDKLVEGQSPKILINLQDVSYLDSSVLANFVELSQKMRRYGGKMAFSNLSEKVQYIFDLAKMDLFFSIAKTSQEALKLL